MRFGKQMKCGGDKSMCDVNPLGPLMHLKQIERDALALQPARSERRFELLNFVWERVVKFSLRTGDAGDGTNVGKQYSSGN
jgi:hypothetical protein